MTADASAWIGAIGGAIGAASGIGAWIVAIRANRRADAANATAKDALDLQARIDAREREFREVAWNGSWTIDDGGEIVFRVTNTGLTDASSVTVVLTLTTGKQQAENVGDIAAGRSGDVRADTGMSGRSAVEALLLRDTPYRVHWSSPLGHSDSWEYRGLQLH